jgi:Cdc6-like AAA superfamily ATPase
LDLFSGRGNQIDRVIDATLQPGQHVILYGERGVGKTSLAKIVHQVLANAGVKTLNSGTVNCDGTDDFSSLCHKVLREVQIQLSRAGLGFQATQVVEQFSLNNILPPKVTPDDFRVALQRIDEELIIIIDEVDRIQDPTARVLLADTLKTLSDHQVNCTVILVGVADNVLQLLGAHESIDRALLQVPMPRMSVAEIDGIIQTGLRLCEMSLSGDMRRYVIALSQGLPHYTHTLCHEAAMNSARRGSIHIDQLDVDNALHTIVQAKHSVFAAYESAISCPQKTSIHPHVLMACSLAEKEYDGHFGSGAIATKLSAILGKNCNLAVFTRHLSEFCSEKRGNILSKKGEERSYRYRFSDPLMEPYALMAGLARGISAQEVVVEPLQQLDLPGI